MSELLITRAAQLVTLAGPARPRVAREMRELGVVEDGAVLVRDGLIVACGPSGEIEPRASTGAARIDARGLVVMPGFVDAHTHVVFAGTREDEYELRAEGATYQEIAARGGGIRSTVRKTRAASEDRLFETALPRIRSLLEHGTTTAEAKSGYGLTVEDELKILRVIRRLDRETPLDLVPTFLGAHEIPDEYRDSREAYIALVVDEMLPRVAEEKLAEYCDVFCESGVFTVNESRRVLARAKELGLGVRLHAEQLSLSGGGRLSAELGAATADHLEWVDDDGIDSLRRAGVIAVLLPGAVFNLGLTRYPPARKMIESNLAVAVATDFNPGSSPTPSMQMALSIACTQMRMTPAEAITAATINAAYSLGRGRGAGSLEAGKQGDIVIFDCADYRQIPYFFGVNHARVVIKSGRVVIDRRDA
ncbi:MAG TPA: imidazolonepropionase [Blastocatellia bacterium]|jgi:imidazolonepropionase|nr:imidazolonepropionase [Blastocatellia bacterium]